MFQSPGPQCQSCSMPLSKDKNGGGSNADGSKSSDYCSYCFEDGDFIDADITLEAMQQKLDGVLKKMKTSWVLRKYVLKQLPKLKRWRACKTDA